MIRRTAEAHERIKEEIVREKRLALLVQREAVGLRDQRVVDQQFPRPPRRP